MTDVKTVSDQLIAISKIIKKKFPNQTVEETILLASEILTEIHKEKV